MPGPRQRILHLIGSLALGGEQTYLVRLVNALGDQEFEHVVGYAQSDRLAGLFRSRVELVKLADRRLDVGALASVGILREIIRLFRRRRFDHLITYSPGIFPYNAHPVARLFRVPVCHIPQRSYSAQSRTERVISRSAVLRGPHYGLINRVVALGSYYHHEFATLWRVPRRKLLLNYIGIELDQFRPDPGLRREFREELRLPPDRLVLAYIGRMHPRKGFLKVLELYQHLLRLRPQAPPVLVAAGDGPSFDEFRQRVADAGLRDVHFLGYREDTARILNGADVYLQATDGPLNGISSIEAMACGVPIVTFVRDEDEQRMAADTTVEGVNGFCCHLGRMREDAERLEAALTPATLGTLGRASREIALAKFDIRAHADRFRQQVLS